MSQLGRRVRGEGTIYLTGGATAVWYNWRAMTVVVDIKPDPEPAGLFEALARLKEELEINVELAAPDHFIPTLPGWRERSIFIAQHGHIRFFHYDPYSQVLSKLQRGHARDKSDVQAMLQAQLIQIDKLSQLFAQIEPQLIRYPAIDPASFRAAVEEFCNANR